MFDTRSADTERLLRLKLSEKISNIAPDLEKVGGRYCFSRFSPYLCTRHPDEDGGGGAPQQQHGWPTIADILRRQGFSAAARLLPLFFRKSHY